MGSLSFPVSEHLKLTFQYKLHLDQTAKPANFPLGYTRFWVASVSLCSCTAYLPNVKLQLFTTGNIMAFLRFVISHYKS